MTARHILVGITGGIAAYKSCELVRLLKKQGYSVDVAMTQSATEFIQPQTLQALSGGQVFLDGHDTHHQGMTHIHSSRTADAILLAPATANTIAKIAQGIADNLITNLILARTCPLAIAPAMNVHMWHNPATQRNIQQLHQDGITVFGPDHGEQACGEYGFGRMLEPKSIVDLLPDLWTPHSLQDKKILITTGATYEAIDPVRGITNISSGKMGIELARACRASGAKVTLIHGIIQSDIPAGLAKVIHTDNAEEMFNAVLAEAPTQDVFISVAAVSDYRVASYSEHKIKKTTGELPTIQLVENPDILATVASLPNAPFCVGFAAESEHVLEYARAKRIRKNIPVIIANHVQHAMGMPTNRVTIIDETQEIMLPEGDKANVAAQIVTYLSTQISN